MILVCFKVVTVGGVSDLFRNVGDLFFFFVLGLSPGNFLPMTSSSIDYVEDHTMRKKIHRIYSYAMIVSAGLALQGCFTSDGDEEIEETVAAEEAPAETEKPASESAVQSTEETAAPAAAEEAPVAESGNEAAPAVTEETPVVESGNEAAPAAEVAQNQAEESPAVEAVAQPAVAEAVVAVPSAPATAGAMVVRYVMHDDVMASNGTRYRRGDIVLVEVMGDQSRLASGATLSTKDLSAKGIGRRRISMGWSKS